MLESIQTIGEFSGKPNDQYIRRYYYQSIRTYLPTIPHDAFQADKTSPSATVTSQGWGRFLSHAPNQSLGITEVTVK